MQKLIEQLDLSTLPDVRTNMKTLFLLLKFELSSQAKPQRDSAEEKAEKADMMMKKAKKRIRQ